MVKYFFRPFAEDGTKTTIPNDVQISGSVSYESGWGPDYQKNILTDPSAKPVPRSQTNQLMFDITENIQQYQEHGVPEFITTADNEGDPFPYAKYAIVRYDDGVNGFRNYMSLVDANDSLPTDATKWRFLDPDAEYVKPGTITMFGVGTVQPGYLACDGSNVSRTTYAALFAVIGTTWGVGDGSTTFGLPNFARRVPMGSGGTGTGVIGNVVGNIGGSENAVNVQHNHALNLSGGNTVLLSRSGGTVEPSVGAGDWDLSTTATIANSGEDGTGKNVQPAAIVSFQIKT